MITKKHIGISVFLDKNMNEQITLVCTPLRFYTHNDEALCFEWIRKIKSIKKYHGAGRALYLSVDSNNIPNKDLLDLMGLFDRYKFDSIQLKVFINAKNKGLFSDANGVGGGSYENVYPIK